MKLAVPFGAIFAVKLLERFPSLSLTAATGCCSACPASPPAALLILHLLIFALQLLVLQPWRSTKAGEEAGEGLSPSRAPCQGTNPPLRAVSAAGSRVSGS